VEEEIKTKRCTKCGEEKELAAFSKKSSSKDGLGTRCKSCDRVVNTKYYEENKDQVLKQCAQYYASNAEKIIAKVKIYHSDNAEKISASRKIFRADNSEKINTAQRLHYLNNKEKISAAKKIYSENNKEKISAARKIYSENNKEKLRAAKKQYYLNNKDEICASHKQYRDSHKETARAHSAKYRSENKAKCAFNNKKWKTANPLAVRTHNMNRRARKRQAEGSYFSRDILSMLQEQQCRCIYCQKDITDEYHIDHITPLSRGGSNFIYNIQLLCPPCNTSKGAKDPEQYECEIGYSRPEAPSGT